MRRLYVLEGSAACRVARWVLARKGLDHETVDVDDALGAELVRRVGTDELPMLEDEGATVVGARAIVSYLERTAEAPSVFPEDAQKRNQAVTLAEFAERVIGPLAAAVRRGDAQALAELRTELGHVREAIGRRALDSGTCHFGDIAVAAHLASCQQAPGLEFDRDYADLAAFIGRVRAACRRQH
jgi:glutathione S-transferase